MADTLDVDVRELDSAEWAELVEGMAQYYFQMSAEEFRAAWEAGEFNDDPCRPGLQKLAMLLPGGGPHS
jgi:hypothetical protein